MVIWEQYEAAIGISGPKIRLGNKIEDVSKIISEISKKAKQNIRLSA